MRFISIRKLTDGSHSYCFGITGRGYYCLSSLTNKLTNKVKRLTYNLLTWRTEWVFKDGWYQKRERFLKWI